MLDESPSLGFPNKSSEESINTNSDAKDDAKSGLPELVQSSSSGDYDESACDDDEDTSDERLSLPMSDESSENSLADSESEDDEAARAPAASTGSEKIVSGVRWCVGVWLGVVHVI